jgi:hypothetical protein
MPSKAKKKPNTFKSSKELFKHREGSLDWEDPSLRSRKCEIRTRTINDMMDLKKPKKLRLMTLCGETLTHENMVFDEPDLNKHVEEIVCLEGNKKVYLGAHKVWRSLPAERKKRITLLQAEDKQVLLPNSGYTTYKRGTGSPRERAHVGRGFDMIWLDWMNSYGKGIDSTISLLMSNISIFERAWNKGNPGLLYLTLACCKEEKADLKTLHLALASFEPDYRKVGYANDSYRLRYYGLATLLNNHLRVRGVVAHATHGVFYREDKHHANTMFFAGFKLLRTNSTRQNPTFVDPTFSGVIDPAER